MLNFTEGRVPVGRNAKMIFRQIKSALSHSELEPVKWASNEPQAIEKLGREEKITWLYIN